MRICVYGAGAVGGYFGAELCAAGHEVTLIARGAHLAAMRENGLRLRIGGEERVVHPRCTDDPSQVPPHQDYVIVALKAHSAPAAADGIAALLGPDTAVVTAVNGVPWWYFYGLDGALRDRRIESIDPGGRQWDEIGPERAIGCVVYPAVELVAPGVVEHISDNKLTIGEPSGERSERARRLCAALVEAGFKAPLRPQIRNEIWTKLWGNLAFNPISALTHATLEEIAGHPEIRAVVRGMMVEAEAIARAIGVRFPIDVDARIAAAGAVGAHRTSMLQDVLAGRPMEVEALLGAVAEIGSMVGVAAPSIAIVLALIRERARHLA